VEGLIDRVGGVVSGGGLDCADYSVDRDKGKAGHARKKLFDVLKTLNRKSRFASRAELRTYISRGMWIVIGLNSADDVKASIQCSSLVSLNPLNQGFPSEK
jgi:hypothetical protein